DGRRGGGVLGVEASDQIQVVQRPLEHVGVKEVPHGQAHSLGGDREVRLREQRGPLGGPAEVLEVVAQQSRVLVRGGEAHGEGVVRVGAVGRGGRRGPAAQRVRGRGGLRRGRQRDQHVLRIDHEV